ncbi:MAG TPA: single-stranded-DNA-specific exonuclease RecJ [Pyrinomonadaceae bacterium]|nr:single-stranded-DNA-specific exonuclease RecJ [Pyrinomonadaceae bacterium]
MKRWVIKKHDREQVNKLSQALNVSPLIAALLISRGFESPETAYKFLNPSYEDLHEPNLLKDMTKSVERILKAVESGEKILIWGDYDVDGTTGTVVLRKALEILGAETGFHVPNRFTEGYGLNIPALEKAKERGYSLVITVDCGSTAFEPIAWAQKNGMDVIVTDHHLTKDEGLPNAFAVVNPNQPDDEYPDKNLAGVGVAFKVAHALLREKGKENVVKGFLKVVAIGTIADIMKLTGENRAIVKIGLQDLPKAHNFGLKALMEVSDCHAEMTSYHIGFRLAPRINAAGRMDVARHVVELFEAETFEKARELADVLNSRNLERQKIQREITELALLEYVENGGSASQSHVAVVAGKGWHRGVIGLAASKISEKLYRPSVVISIEDDGIGHGSARSIANYHLLNGLDSCGDLMEQFGGHAAAAGMKIKAENIDDLRVKLNEHAVKNLSDEDLIPEIKVDAVVLASTLDLSVVEELKMLEPFGAGNPKPIFVTKDLFLLDEPYVMKEKHLKLRVADAKGKQFEAVWWDGVEKSKEQTLKPRTRIELAYTPEANTWQGNTRLQLVVEDLRTDN